MFAAAYIRGIPAIPGEGLGFLTLLLPDRCVFGA
jgi:hypothetical protein